MTDADNHVIIRPKRREDDAAAAEIMFECFGDKYCGGSGRPKKIRALILDEMKWRGKGGNFFVAARGEKTAGIMEMLAHGIPAVPESVMIELRLKHLGIGEGIKSIYILSQLARDMPEGECFVGQLGVLPGARKQGVASALLARAEEFALNMTSDYLCLWAAAGNINAIRLYESSGFSIDQRLVSKTTSRLLGIDEWVKMKKKLCKQ